MLHEIEADDFVDYADAQAAILFQGVKEEEA